MIELKLWASFKKRINSTKQPTTNPAYTFQVTLKNGTSLENPTFILGADDVSGLLSVNYARALGTYYFVNDITILNNSLIELICSHDPMATHKTDIGNYHAFVERSASQYDTMLYDSMIAQQQNIASIDTATTTIPNWDDGSTGGRPKQSGTFVLRTISASGIKSYAMDYTTLGRALDFMFTFNNFEDFINDLTIKSFFNPFQYIVSLMWFPFTIDAFNVAHSGAVVPFGYWNATVPTERSVHQLNPVGNSSELTLNMPTKYFSGFRAYNSSWSRYDMYIPAIGHVPIDAKYCDGIKLSYNVDILTGVLTALIYSKDGALISTLSGQIGIPIQLGQINTDIGKIAQGTMTMAGGMMSGNPIATIGGALSTFNSVLQPTPSTIGSAGNQTTLKVNPNIIVTRTAFGGKEFQTETQGRPLMLYRTLNTLSGFVKCGGANIDIAGFTGDKTLINNYLNEGFYYE